MSSKSNMFDPRPLGLMDPCATYPCNHEIPFSDLAFAAVDVDWKATPEVHVFKVDLPGVKKEQVKVVYEAGILYIYGELTRENKEQVDKWHLKERRSKRSGKFLRMFKLVENVKKEQIKAAMANGMLTVIVPKEVKKPVVRSIEISGGGEEFQHWELVQADDLKP